MSSLGCAFSVRSRSIAVEILVHIEDQERIVTSSRVFDVLSISDMFHEIAADDMTYQKRGVGTGQPVLGVGPEVSRKSDRLRVGSSASDGADSSLNRSGPV